MAADRPHAEGQFAELPELLGNPGYSLGILVGIDRIAIADDTHAEF